MLKNNLGYPRVGAARELKKACEQYWAGKITQQGLSLVKDRLLRQNWELQKEAGTDLIPSNDFSYYDQVLDMSLTVGNIPERYNPVLTRHKGNTELDLYFAMARGYQQEGLDIKAMEMTKWFDTNYHYIVPEFVKGQNFQLFSNKVFADFEHSKEVLGKVSKPVLIGPVSYLLLGKEKEAGFDRIDLLQNLLPVYLELLQQLRDRGAEWVQLDEPFLAMDLTQKEKQAFRFAYQEIKKHCGGLKTMVASYFDGLRDNAALAASLPVCAHHIDLVRAPQQLEEVLNLLSPITSLSLGVVDGRNIWKNDYRASLLLVRSAIQRLGEARVMLAPSCSLLHVPFDLDAETRLEPELKSWMAFAKQKLQEVQELYAILQGDNSLLEANQATLQRRATSALIHKETVKNRVAALTAEETGRRSNFTVRQQKQQQKFKLPLFPTTTIGSFPQTADIRQLRARLKQGEVTQAQYEQEIQTATEKAIRWQEAIGLDVLVHGEFERNDMVEYFGELLDGIAYIAGTCTTGTGCCCTRYCISCTLRRELPVDKMLTFAFSEN